MKNGEMQILSHGTKHWYLNNKLHRTDGPAIENVNGHKVWYIHGKLHRTDGPAVEWANGYKVWYLNGDWYGYGATPPVDYTLAVLILQGMSE